MLREPKFVHARVRMVNIPGRSALRLSVGARPNIFFSGNYFPSQIEECDSEIGSGESGDLVLMILDEEDYPLLLSVGSVFEMRDGPVNKIADAEVLSMW